MQIRVGNLSMMTTAKQLAELFLPFGKVSSSKIISGDLKGRSRGMGFIEMEYPCGKRAIQRLHRLLFMNSYIEVHEVAG
jgi:RNA recognition motif-containing protein